MANDSNYRSIDNFKRAHAKLSNSFRKAKDHRKDRYHRMGRDVVHSHGNIYAESLNVKDMIEGPFGMRSQVPQLQVETR